MRKAIPRGRRAVTARRRAWAVGAGGGMAAAFVYACTYSVPVVVATDQATPNEDASPDRAEGAPARFDASADATVRDAVGADGASNDALLPCEAAMDGAMTDGTVGAIVFEEATKSAAGAPASTVSVAGATSPKPGDLLLVYISAGIPAATPVDLTSPAGWSTVGLAKGAATGETTVLGVYAKIAGLAEPATYTWTLDNAAYYAAWLLRYSGVDPAQPIDTQSAAPATMSGGGYQTASITTSAPNEVVVASFTGHVAGITGWTTPTDMTPRVYAGNTANRGGASDDELFAMPGTAGPFSSSPSGMPTITAQTVILTEVLAIRPCP